MLKHSFIHTRAFIGNSFTFAHAGAELRFGRSLPDDFGTAPMMSGYVTAPSGLSAQLRRPVVHAFLAFETRYMLRNITLDGNTWRDSPSVERERLTADLVLGFATRWRDWEITIARYLHSEEYETETRYTAGFGSITIRRAVGGG